MSDTFFLCVCGGSLLVFNLFLIDITCRSCSESPSNSVSGSMCVYFSSLFTCIYTSEGKSSRGEEDAREGWATLVVSHMDWHVLFESGLGLFGNGYQKS